MGTKPMDAVPEFFLGQRIAAAPLMSLSTIKFTAKAPTEWLRADKAKFLNQTPG